MKVKIKIKKNGPFYIGVHEVPVSFSGKTVTVSEEAFKTDTIHIIYDKEAGVIVDISDKDGCLEMLEALVSDYSALGLNLSSLVVYSSSSLDEKEISAIYTKHARLPALIDSANVKESRPLLGIKHFVVA